MEKDGQKVRFRALNVLDDKYHDQIAKKISSTLEDHKTYMKKLKNEGFHIIGYCRKSDLKKERNLQNLLQQMVVNLYKRSLVDSVFASPCCNSNVPFSKRDLNGKTMIFSALQNIHGDSKGKSITAIVKQNKICLYSIYVVTLF
ncbi:hypothetical protein INT48_008421 [Thamnidium elegans]|uniref:Uncharacterized protein n=1 Tax=Thamnidium elegans TaxID=101142 RepID=A0A8H7VT51_9FUNG|nr:hypothetical protein INT48_008421 [Thamnidium elegans]